jgi:hypothetical protein
MGCGSVRSQPILYINEVNPPLHKLRVNDPHLPEVFPHTGFVKNDDGTYFDDREFVKQSQVVHIEEVVIYSEEYIQGISVLYFLDGNMKQVHHNAQQMSKFTKLPLMPSDSLVAIEVTYGDEFIHSIKITTTNNTAFEVVGSKGKGPETAGVDLRKDARAIVAFKGRHEVYLRSLHFYSWSMLTSK